MPSHVLSLLMFVPGPDSGGMHYRNTGQPAIARLWTSPFGVDSTKSRPAAAPSYSYPILTLHKQKWSTELLTSVRSGVERRGPGRTVAERGQHGTGGVHDQRDGIQPPIRIGNVAEPPGEGGLSGRGGGQGHRRVEGIAAVGLQDNQPSGLPVGRQMVVDERRGKGKRTHRFSCPNLTSECQVRLTGAQSQP